jgi:hypothetical protein
MRRFVAYSMSISACMLFAGPVASAQLTKCKISYDLEGWSVFYKRSDGTGRITCTGGQSASVRLSARGGGVTFGTFSVTGGKGTFSGVRDISDLYGSYVEATAHVGAGGSTDARAMAKGDVNLSLAGTGQGVNLGFALGAFTIQPR